MTEPTAPAPEWDPGYLKPFDLSRRAWLILLAVAIVAAGLLGGAIKSRSDYGTFAFWGLPNRINYCGRRYYPSPSDIKTTHAKAEATYSVPAKWKTVGWTLAMKRIEAAVIDADSRGDSVCTMQLFISTGDGTYRSYGLSGGP